MMDEVKTELQAQRVRKSFGVAFWATFALLFLFSNICVLVVALMLFHGRHNVGGFAGALPMPILVLSYSITFSRYRRKFPDLFSQRQETLYRSVETVPDVEALVVQYPPKVWVALAMSFFVIATGVFIAGLCHVGIGAFPVAGWLFVTGFAIAALGRIPVLSLSVRIDEKGITSWERGAFYRSVPWERIAVCEINTSTFGEPGRRSRIYTLKDDTGVAQMTFFLAFVPKSDHEAFDAAIRRAFGDSA